MRKKIWKEICYCDGCGLAKQREELYAGFYVCEQKPQTYTLEGMECELQEEIVEDDDRELNEYCADCFLKMLRSALFSDKEKSATDNETHYRQNKP